MVEGGLEQRQTGLKAGADSGPKEQLRGLFHRQPHNQIISARNHLSVSLPDFSSLALSLSATPSQRHTCSVHTFRKSGHWLSACGQEAQNQCGSPFAGAVET